MFARNIKKEAAHKINHIFLHFYGIYYHRNVCVIKAKRTRRTMNDADDGNDDDDDGDDDGDGDGDGNGAKGSHKNAAIYLLIYAQQ